MTNLCKLYNRPSNRKLIRKYSNKVTKRVLCPKESLDYNPQAPVAQKIADEVVFRHFQGERVEFFFNRTSLTLQQIFDAHLLETTDLSPSRFHFQ